MHWWGLAIVFLLPGAVQSFAPIYGLAHPARVVARFAGGNEGMILTEDNVEAVLGACREELSTLFGYRPENKAVGITGAVEFVEVDGPTVVVDLTGRFWHEKRVVLARVESYIQQRIPECIEVTVGDPSQLDDADPTQSDNERHE
jgi:hypothetical protein